MNGVRCSYAFWPLGNTAKLEIFKLIGETPKQNALFHGAVVKANGLADRTVRTYLRSQETGLLENITAQLEVKDISDTDLKIYLIDAIKRSAAAGHPFTHTGGPGVRHRLPSAFHNVSRHKIERLAQELLNEKKIVKGMAAYSKEDKGVGEFNAGAGKFEITNF